MDRYKFDIVWKSLIRIVKKSGKKGNETGNFLVGLEEDEVEP